MEILKSVAGEEKKIVKISIRDFQVSGWHYQAQQEVHVSHGAMAGVRGGSWRGRDQPLGLLGL